MSSAIVVGAGPNGLACAATLASRGVEVTVFEAAERIGGGTRSSELTVPGLLHDECSATHPMAVSSPAVAGLELERHGSSGPGRRSTWPIRSTGAGARRCCARSRRRRRGWGRGVPDGGGSSARPRRATTR